MDTAEDLELETEASGCSSVVRSILSPRRRKTRSSKATVSYRPCYTSQESMDAYSWDDEDEDGSTVFHSASSKHLIPSESKVRGRKRSTDSLLLLVQQDSIMIPDPYKAPNSYKLDLMADNRSNYSGVVGSVVSSLRNVPEYEEYKDAYGYHDACTYIDAPRYHLRPRPWRTRGIRRRNSRPSSIRLSMPRAASISRLSLPSCRRPSTIQLSVPSAASLSRCNSPRMSVPSSVLLTRPRPGPRTRSRTNYYATSVTPVAEKPICCQSPSYYDDIKLIPSRRKSKSRNYRPPTCGHPSSETLIVRKPSSTNSLIIRRHTKSDIPARNVSDQSIVISANHSGSVISVVSSTGTLVIRNPPNCLGCYPKSKCKMLTRPKSKCEMLARPKPRKICGSEALHRPQRCRRRRRCCKSKPPRKKKGKTCTPTCTPKSCLKTESPVTVSNTSSQSSSSSSSSSSPNSSSKQTPFQCRKYIPCPKSRRPQVGCNPIPHLLDTKPQPQLLQFSTPDDFDPKPPAVKTQSTCTSVSRLLCPIKKTNCRNSPWVIAMRNYLDNFKGHTTTCGEVMSLDSIRLPQTDRELDSFLASVWSSRCCSLELSRQIAELKRYYHVKLTELKTNYKIILSDLVSVSESNCTCVDDTPKKGISTIRDAKNRLNIFDRLQFELKDKVAETIIRIAPKTLQTWASVQHRARRRLPKKAVEVMSRWFNTHSCSPYPSTDQKKWLADRSGVSVQQVSTWFASERRLRGKKYHKQNVPSRRKQSCFLDNETPYSFLPSSDGGISKECSAERTPYSYLMSKQIEENSKKTPYSFLRSRICKDGSEDSSREMSVQGDSKPHSFFELSRSSSSILR